MKSTISTLALCLILTICSFAQGSTEHEVEHIEGFRFLCRYQNFYLGAQPSLEKLEWLKGQGVTRIINLRSDRECQDFVQTAFDIETRAKAMGFDYQHIAVDGMKDYTPENLEKFIALMSDSERILIHCAGAFRVSDFFMAYLVKARGYTIDEAVRVGKSVKFTFPLEKLLDVEISMRIKEI